MNTITKRPAGLTGRLTPQATSDPCLNLELEDGYLLRLSNSHRGEAILTISYNGRGAVGKYQDVYSVQVPASRREIVAQFMRKEL